MNRNIKNILFGAASLFSIMLLSTGLTGCKDKEDGMVTAVTIQEAVWASVNNCMQLTLKDNATLQVTPFIMPRDAANQTVTYSSKYPNLMEVSASGLITGKAPGVDTLTVSATDGSGISTWYRVVIVDHMVKATAINVTAAGSNMTLKTGGSAFDLGACVTLAPDDTWDKTVTYQSNNETIATVTENGMVAPVGIGSTTITVKTADGSNISRDCNVTVQDLVQRWDELDRAAWTVTTQTATGYGHTIDGANGPPQLMFDGNAATYSALTKPGKNYNDVPSQDANFLPGFTVDMQSQQTVNFIAWKHRGGNGLGMSVFAINIFKSDNGVDFTQINTEGLLWIPTEPGYTYLGNSSGQNPSLPAAASTTLHKIEIPSTECRYFKVQYAGWSDIYKPGQVQHPDLPGTATTSNYNLCVAEFGLGQTYLE
ncbi:MAG: Ig-like domain-containing protein [Bacteroidales bacterium]|nr:Ig-like domain-containing protein [Bacteroidales bacterium]